VTIVLANLLLIATNLSQHENIFRIVQSKNPTLKWIVLGTLLALGLVLYIPFLRNVFSLYIFTSIDLVLCLGFAIACLIWFECVKKFPIWFPVKKEQSRMV